MRRGRGRWWSCLCVLLLHKPLPVTCLFFRPLLWSGVEADYVRTLYLTGKSRERGSRSTNSFFAGSRSKDLIRSLAQLTDDSGHGGSSPSILFLTFTYMPTAVRYFNFDQISMGRTVLLTSFRCMPVIPSHKTS
jgi:hypothetical protein